MLTRLPRRNDSFSRYRILLIEGPAKMKWCLLSTIAVVSLISAPLAVADDEERVENNLATSKLVTGGFPARMINGAEAIRSDANTITVFRGSVTDNTGRYLLSFARSVTANIKTVGVGGRDGAATTEDLVQARNGTLALDDKAGYAQGKFLSLPIAGWYTPVYVGRSSDADRNSVVPGQIVLTRMQSSMRINTPAHVAISPTYDVRRSAPIAYFFDPESGFRPTYCYGWPQPFCVWTRGGTAPIYLAQGLKGSGQPLEINASDFVPPTGRLLRLQIRARSEGGRGDVLVQTLPRAGSGIAVVSLARPDDVAIGTIEFAPTSKRIFTLIVPQGVTVDLIPLGFSMIQPT